ncbi:MAG: IS200/IS605 family accessory protein TnpB-related protein [Halobacteriales archaeon]
MNVWSVSTSSRPNSAGSTVWSQQRCSKAIVTEAKRLDCTHIVFEDLEQIRDRINDDKKLQQWAFRELQRQTKSKAELAGIVVETVEPSHTSQ